MAASPSARLATRREQTTRQAIRRRGHDIWEPDQLEPGTCESELSWVDKRSQDLESLTCRRIGII